MARTIVSNNEIKKVLRFSDTPIQSEKDEHILEHLRWRRWNLMPNVNVYIFSVLVIVALTVLIRWCYSTFIGTDAKIYFSALAFGFAVGLFTWMITYMDSKQPGVSPPSPFSPRRYRELSGHTYHLNYVMSFVNGITVVILSVWWQKS